MKEAVTKAGAYCHSKGQKAPATRGWDRGFCSPGGLSAELQAHEQGIKQR